jgi:hypothetical protein
MKLDTIFKLGPRYSNLEKFAKTKTTWFNGYHVLLVGVYNKGLPNLKKSENGWGEKYIFILVKSMG